MPREIDAIELEKQINEKFGKQKDFEIEERFQLVRELRTAEIVVVNFEAPEDGHHLLKNATQEELEKVAEYFDMTPLVKEEDNADHIPGPDPKDDKGNLDDPDGEASHIPD